MSTPTNIRVLGRLKPQKGVDYLTENDKAEIVNEVLEELPNYNP